MNFWKSKLLRAVSESLMQFWPRVTLGTSGNTQNLNEPLHNWKSFCNIVYQDEIMLKIFQLLNSVILMAIVICNICHIFMWGVLDFSYFVDQGQKILKLKELCLSLCDVFICITFLSTLFINNYCLQTH